jgi:hypothetical protein
MSENQPLSPEQEQQVVDAIVALDWADYEATRGAVARVSGITDQQAECISSQLSDRRIIKKLGNNVVDNGPGKVKWGRGGVPTSLELIHRLKALQGIVTLDRSRIEVAPVWEISESEAENLLYGLRDRNILILRTLDWRWCRPGEVE